MCMIKTIQYKVNNKDALERAYVEICSDYGDKMICGVFHHPFFMEFDGWDQFHDLVDKVERSMRELSRNEELVVYGEINVRVR
jgi:hypothetical protein